MSLKQEMLKRFIPHPENHTCKGMDEWFSGGIPLHRNPKKSEITAVKPWSFIIFSSLFFVLVFCLQPCLAFYGEGENKVSEKLEKGTQAKESAIEMIQGLHLEYNARNLRDPFDDLMMQKNPLQKKNVKETEVEMAPPALSVKGLVWGGLVPQAIINDKVVKKGDHIEGAEIVEIGKDGVVIRFSGRIYKLSSPAASQKSADKEEVIQ